jgi:hypothetical protein
MGEKWRAWKEGRMELDLVLHAVYRRGLNFLEEMKQDGLMGSLDSSAAAANFGQYVQMWDQYFEKMKGAEEKPSPEQARDYLQEMVTPDLKERIAEMYPDQELDNKSGSHDNDDRNQDAGTGGNLKPDPTGLDEESKLDEDAGENPSDLIAPTALSKKIVIERGGYRFEKYYGDKKHGGEHWHVFKGKSKKELGRLALDGRTITGNITKKKLPKKQAF